MLNYKRNQYIFLQSYNWLGKSVKIDGMKKMGLLVFIFLHNINFKYLPTYPFND